MAKFSIANTGFGKSAIRTGRQLANKTVDTLANKYRQSIESESGVPYAAMSKVKDYNPELYSTINDVITDVAPAQIKKALDPKYDQK